MLRILFILLTTSLVSMCSAQSFTVSHGGIPAEHGVGVWTYGPAYLTLNRKRSPPSGLAYGARFTNWTSQGAAVGFQDITIPGTLFMHASTSFGNGQYLVGSAISEDSTHHDLLVISTTPALSYNWTNQIELPEDQVGLCVTALPNGDALIAGVANGTGHDVLVSRFSSTGQEMWTTTYPMPADQEAHSITTTSSGFTIAGRTNGPNGDDAIVMHGDLNGNLLWTKTLGGTAADEAHSIIAQNNDDLLMAGTTHSFGDTNHLGDRMKNIWLVRMNSIGDTLWTRTFGDTLTHRTCTTMAQEASGDVFIAGTFGNTAHNELLIQRATSAGSQQWERIFDHGKDERILHLLPLPNNTGFIATGWTWTDNGCQTLLLRRNAQGM